MSALKEKKTIQEMQKADTDQKTEDAEGVLSLDCRRGLSQRLADAFNQ